MTVVASQSRASSMHKEDNSLVNESRSALCVCAVGASLFIQCTDNRGKRRDDF